MQIKFAIYIKKILKVELKNSQSAAKIALFFDISKFF